VKKRLYYTGSSSFENPQGLGPAGCVLQIGDKFIGIDRGLEFQGKKIKEPDEAILNGRKLHALIVTHDHADHASAIGLGEMKGILEKSAPIYASPQALRGIPLILDETFRRNICRNYFEAVSRPCGRLRVVPRGEFEILPGIRAFTFPVGHLPGAFGIIIDGVLFMGDSCEHDQLIVSGVFIPDQIPDEHLPHTIAISDNTPTAGHDYDDESAKLVAHVKKCLADGKVVIIPAFVRGRAQNVAMTLAREIGQTVYCDGSIQALFKIYDEEKWSERDRQISLNNIRFISSVDERWQLLFRGGPLVIVTPAGMGDGLARWYMDQGLENPKYEFVGVGYAVPESPMGRIYEHMESAKRGKTISLPNENGFKLEYRMRAGLARFHLSAHGGAEMMFRMCKELVERRGEKMKLIILTHGTVASKQSACLRLEPFADKIRFGNMGSIVEI